MTKPQLIAIGSSTGGTEALRVVLSGLPVHMPPILVVQHMPASFTPGFAERLNEFSALTVVETRDQQTLQPGHVYLAPGHSHLRITKVGNALVTHLNQEAPFNRHRPSVDVLFHSVADLVGAASWGVLLTGMGKDGAKGLLAMKQKGAHTIAQDEKSCVVYGMPKEAVEIGAVDIVLSLQEIAPYLAKHP